MEDNFSEEVYTGVNFSTVPYSTGYYESCVFIACDLHGVNLSGSKFVDCSFDACDLSNALLGKTVFRDVVFKDCKMLGLAFSDCGGHGLGVSFTNCMLDHAQFCGVKAAGARFDHCSLREVDFSGADLCRAFFGGADCYRALFEDCNLEKADLRHAIAFSIDPAKNRVRKVKCSLSGLPGFVDRFGLEIDPES